MTKVVQAGQQIISLVRSIINFWFTGILFGGELTINTIYNKKFDFVVGIGGCCNLYLL